MDKFYIKILMIEEKIEKNHKTQSLIKITAFMLLFFIGVCNANPDRTTSIMAWWIITILGLIVLFCFDSYYEKRNKAYEFEVYRLEAEDLKNKKEIAEIKGQILSDTIQNKALTFPSDKIIYPFKYYIIVLFFDLIFGIFMIW